MYNKFQTIRFNIFLSPSPPSGMFISSPPLCRDKSIHRTFPAPPSNGWFLWIQSKDPHQLSLFCFSTLLFSSTLLFPSIFRPRTKKPSLQSESKNLSTALLFKDPILFKGGCFLFSSWVLSSDAENPFVKLLILRIIYIVLLWIWSRHSWRSYNIIISFLHINDSVFAWFFCILGNSTSEVK